jgi:cell wall-associated NlpC family hydrolase
VAIASSCCLLPLAHTAGADTLSAEKAKAAQIQQQIQSTGQQIDALDQQYEGAQAKKSSLDQQISTTKAKITQTQSTIAGDRTTLKKAAVNAYVSNGAAASENPLFSGNESSVAAAREYDDVAEGNLGTAVANLNTAQNQLDAQKAVLTTQDNQAAQAVTTAQSAYSQAQSLQTQQQATLGQVNATIATLIQKQQAAAAAAAEAAAQAKLTAAANQAKAQQTAQAAAQTATASSGGGGGSTVKTVVDPPPPPSSGGAGTVAVHAAESQIGVPYEWGAESPGSGFDCSGLTAWAWGQAGVSLPHYSGAQYADSTPVPLSDLQPGDLLFYGPGGATHVAMYVGGGSMIEAPYTGASVWITGLRTGTGRFAGAGRP